MGKIYTVGSKSNKPLLELGHEMIDFGHITSSDLDLHNFVLSLKEDFNIEKLIIEVFKEDLKSLKLAYHIRLTLEELRSLTLIPILFVSDRSLKQIISTNGIWSHIFATKGVGFASYGLANVEIEHVTGLKSTEYKSYFLDIIKVLPDESVGKHSIANQWGAAVMDKAANTFALLQEKDISRAFSRLYLKHSEALMFNYEFLNVKANEVIGNIAVGRPEYIKAEGCRVLLIDDEAGKGWGSVLRKVFKTSSIDDFQVISEQVKDYESFSYDAKQKIENGNFDLFLVDLRLNGAHEEDIFNVEEFSGAKVLKEIKKNKGNQIIIFTASNKAWNIKPLLDSGADAYYIKESPEYQFSRNLSKKNFERFKDDAERLLRRSYLRNLFVAIEELNNKIKALKIASSYSNEFLDEISNLLEQSFDMHSQAREERQFAYAYVTLYMIIEHVNSELVSSVEEDDETRWIIGGENLKDWLWDTRRNAYLEQGPKVIGNKPPEWQKMVGIWKQKFNSSSSEEILIKPVKYLIQMRNNFMHNDGQLNRKIYSNKGFLELFALVNEIILRL